MEKTKKRFTLSCYAILAFTAILLVDLIMFLINGANIRATLKTQLSENLVDVAYWLAVGITVIERLLGIWLALWGLNVIKNGKTGRGHMVLEFILAVLAFSSLYDAIKNLTSTNDIALAVFSLVLSAIWLIILCIYDWQSMKFRRLKLEEQKQS